MTNHRLLARVIVVARHLHRGTAARFHYDLSRGPDLGRAAYGALDSAIYHVANEGHPEVTPGDHDQRRARWARADALHTELAPDIQRLIATAKATPYTGWSNAGRDPIRYAAPAHQTGDVTPSGDVTP